MPNLDEKYNEFSRELSRSVSPEMEQTDENVCDERSYDDAMLDGIGRTIKENTAKLAQE